MNVNNYRFSTFSDLSGAEALAISNLATRHQHFRRREIIRREGVPAEQIYVLIDGWATSSVFRSSGRRLISKVHLPGDILGAPSIAVLTAAETLRALTSCNVGIIPLSRLGALFDQHPRLGFILFQCAQLERLMLVDALSSVGRSRATERLASFLVDMHDRSALAGLTTDQSFDLPLSQEEIADLTGLTAVHVSRTLGAIETKGLLSRDGRQFTLPDLDGLRHVAGHTKREVRRNAPWLPPQRA